MLNEIKKYIKDNKPSGITSRLKANEKYWGEITKYTSHIQTEKKTEQVYLYINQIDNITCPCGNNKRKFISLVKGYYEFCSQKDYPDCIARNTAASKRRKKTLLANGGYGLANPESKAKAKVTILKKYGVENVSQLQETKDKVKKTVLERYGVDNILKNGAIKEKIKRTNLERYGVDNPLKSNAIKGKVKDTNLERYGVDNPLKSNAIKGKVKDTNLERYGVEVPSTLDEIKNKSRITNLSLYGDKIPMNTQLIRDQIKATNLKKYGVENASQKHYSKKLLKILSCKENLEHEYKTKDMHEIADDHGVTWTTINDYLVKYGIRERWKSSPEIAICNWLTDLNINFISNTRKIISPLELDIAIPEKNIAIEYCGLYWHGAKSGKTKEYHKNKLELANEQGYRLITIFEDEWIHNKDICKDRLKHILGINNKTCYARQTKIKEISNKEHKDFLNKHHIQGFIGAKIKLGAYYNDELVAVMTFGKKRRALGNKTQKYNTYELLRFCTKGSIPGIGSKLFKHFTRNYNPEEIVSYCDLRWGTGEFYKKLNFKLSHISGPNYWYFKYNILRRYHRYQFRKQALTEMASYSFDKTEWQIMQEEGYDKIYDCGNKVFKWVK